MTARLPFPTVSLVALALLGCGPQQPAQRTDKALKVSGADLPQGPGRPTFSQVCSRCHSLPDPRQHSKDDWPAVVMRMETRMQQMQVNRPQQAEMQEILAYLQQASTGVKKP